MQASAIASAGVVLFLLLTGCGADSAPVTRSDDPVSDSTSSTRQPSTSPKQPPEQKSRTRRHMGGGDGRTVRVALHTHCGVRGIVVDGVLWLADPPLGGHNPPRGWDENRVTGSFTLVSKRRAEFRGEHGERASFRRAPSGSADPNEGCE